MLGVKRTGIYVFMLGLSSEMADTYRRQYWTMTRNIFFFVFRLPYESVFLNRFFLFFIHTPCRAHDRFPFFLIFFYTYFPFDLCFLRSSLFRGFLLFSFFQRIRTRYVPMLCVYVCRACSIMMLFSHSLFPLRTNGGARRHTKVLEP